MDLFKTLLVIHIAAGAIGFIVAPVALIVKKGGNVHRKWGKVFFWSMTIVAATALVMAPMHGNVFLTLVAVFSFYLAFSGYRALYRKDFYVTRKTALIDWFFAIVNVLFSLTLLVLGFINFPEAFGIISIVFGLLGTLLGTRDIISFIKPPVDRQKWFYSHMIGMVASYIAAMSAFSAVNFNFEWMHPAIQWLWPTLIGTPLLNIWVKSYKKKFGKGRRIKEEVVITIKADAVD